MNFSIGSMFRAIYSSNKLKSTWRGENYLVKCVTELPIIMNIVIKEKFLMKIIFFKNYLKDYDWFVFLFFFKHDTKLQDWDDQYSLGCHQLQLPFLSLLGTIFRQCWSKFCFWCCHKIMFWSVSTWRSNY